MTWTTPTDLDAVQAPEFDPGRPGVVLAVMAFAVGLLVGMVAGPALRSLTRDDRADSPAGRLVATLALDEVTLAPTPVVILDVTLHNLGETVVVPRSVSLSGAGLPAGVQAFGGGRLEPQGSRTVTVRSPLNCPPDSFDRPPIASVLSVAPAADGSSWQTPVTTIGAAGTADGLCLAAEFSLPVGWREPGHLVTATFNGPMLHLAVDQLPADATSVVSARIDGQLVTFPPATITATAASVDLIRPSPACSPTGQDSRLPTGVQLLLSARRGDRFSYIAVGGRFARWVLAGRASCPPNVRPAP